MEVLAALLFMVSTVLVFTKKFCDGILAKHFLVFAAIAAVILYLEPYNTRALAVSVVLFFAGIAYWAWRNQKQIKQHWRSHHSVW